MKIASPPRLLRRTAPLRDSGLVEFAAEDMDAYPILHDTVREFAGENTPADQTIYRYASYRELLGLLSRLQNRMRAEEANAIRCRFKQTDGKPGGSSSASSAEGSSESFSSEWEWLSGLFGSVGGRSVSDYILHRHFTTYLQPVVQPDGTIAGYECLLRPLPEQQPFRPAELFETARSIGQHSFLDREAREAAVNFSASHLPQGMKRFINFLPSSLISPDRCLNGTFETIRSSGTDPRDLVFEVVETERLDHPELSRIFNLCREQGVLLALDDVGDGYATLETVERLKPDYVKMDRQWVSGCDRDPVKQAYIKKLLDRASRYHGVVLAEGVEREEEWRYLREAGVPLYQGYLFGKAAPVPL
ncbi:EAL domain-containing protein [Cohnella faecalis]|uniref:EAL domain-containing protein n=1 Tax=Cohnella faecalis TaxID=2315694 RepID=A0A398CN38_9BACL|nr:EAL domain-containing protein [Cohnella faecalis]RIE02659.1 EAL domain-containing protein [Cohnella faecalis]